jgi:hypothetical protein
MMPTVHNIENNMAQLRKIPMKDPSKVRGEFTYGYHPDHEAQNLDEEVFKVDEYPRSSNDPPHFQWQNDIIESWLPTWLPSWNTEWPEAGWPDPVFFGQGSSEPAELPVFWFPELEPFESSKPFDTNLPRYCHSLDKNIKDEEVRFIAQTQLKRALEDKDTNFRVRGRDVDPEKIARTVKRKKILEDELLAMPSARRYYPAFFPVYLSPA